MITTGKVRRVIGVLARLAGQAVAKRSLQLLALGFALTPGAAHANAVHDQIAAFVAPYVRSGNFSGSILVVQSGRVVFRNSYGRADATRSNRADTRYHVASVSMLFTASTVLRLVEDGRLSLDAKVSQFVPDVPNGDTISLSQLLQQISGLPDANDLPGYDDLLNAHQTPETLVQFIRGRAPRFEPGSPSQGEEHSAYNLLALIAERVTGLPFREAVQREVFAPLGMRNSGIDDDSPIRGPVALGHEENGAVNTQPAAMIHWSTKTGNGSAYSTVADVRRFLDGFFGSDFLSEAHRQFMLDHECGWERDEEPTRFREPIYFQSGNGAGFASVVIHLPRIQTDIIILSNVQIPVPPSMGFNLATMLEGGEYRRLVVRATPLTPAEVAHVAGSFTFGSDFFRRNVTLRLVGSADGGMVLKWPATPSAPARDAPVIVVDDHHFIDRHFWTRFSVADDESGRAARLTYGSFIGVRSWDNSPDGHP